MKHTLRVCNNEQMRSLTHTQTCRTVNTVYIEYKSVVTHSHSLTHTSADQPASVQ